MFRNRRRFADIVAMAYYSAAYLLVTVVVILTISSRISNTHAAVRASGDSESFLYITEDSVPVLDHGHPRIDFTKSTSPKVVEFYDPKCGACQAFKYNYVEVAKKIQAQKPNVEFYGVSCEAYQSICAKYGGSSVPRIFAFPSSSTEPSGGIEVPKGAGTIYFLSARLMKALRTPEEIASDAQKLASLDSPKRRLESENSNENGEEFSEDGDEEDEDEGVEDEEDEDVDGEVSQDGDDTETEEDNNVSYGSEDLLSEDRGDTEELSEGKDDGSEENRERPSAEGTNQSEGRQDRHRKASSGEKLSHGRYEDAALLEKYMADDKSGHRHDQAPGHEHPSNKDKNSSDVSYRRDASEQHGQQLAKPQGPGKKQGAADDKSGHRHDQVSAYEHSGDKDKNSSDGSDRRDAPERQGQQLANPQGPGMNQGASDKFEKYKHTDAYKNTMREFEAKDTEKGKPKGYHYKKMLEERAASFNKTKGGSAGLRDARQAAPQKLPGIGQSVGGTTHQGGRKSEDNGSDVRMPGSHEVTRKNNPTSPHSTLGEIRKVKRTPEKKESLERMSGEHGAVSQKNPIPRQSIRVDVHQREEASEDEETSGDKGSDASMPDDFETTGQKSPITRQSIRGDVRQREEKSNDKESEASMPAELDSAVQKSPSSPQSIRGDIRQRGDASEDKRHAKSVLGRDVFPSKPIMNGGQAHNGPRPIVNINRPQDNVDSHPNPPLPPRDHIMRVGGDNFVNPFSNDPVKAKKFEEYIARRKQTLERREKVKHPIKSIMGNGSIKDAEEDIRAMHMKKSPMHNYKSQYNKQEDISSLPGQKPDLRPEAQHKTIGEKVLKKIPIVKRAFKRSKGEETLNDAALSFTRGLLMGVFKTNAPLDYKRKAALVDWLDLLRVSLPPEIGLHELIDTLKYNIDSISQRQENLLEVINKHPMPDHQWSIHCTKGMRSGGFFCGFWKLLHVMSVGFAEQAGGLALGESSSSIRVFSPKEAGDVVREYMAFFFNCAKCSKRFIAQYDDCSFDRCRRLGDETVGASEESWKEFPLWLWQVHNDISIFKSDKASDFNKIEGRKAEAKKWELSLKAVYPHIDQCITCVSSDGTWKLNEVYRHLEKEYWTFGSEVVLDPKMEKFLKHTDIERGNVSRGLGAYILVAFIMLLTVFGKKYRIRATGRHKKVESSSSGGFSKKYRDS